MTDTIGAAAPASAQEKLRSSAGGAVSAQPSPADVATTLTPAMRRALWRQQRDLVEHPRATVAGPGMTMRGLRQRGIVVGAMPYAVLTDADRAVIDAAALSPADGDR